MERSLLDHLKYRLPRFVGLLISLSQLIHYKKKWGQKKDFKNYTDFSPGLDLTYGDAALAFFCRILLEEPYETVIEIGAFHATRITTLKKLFPNIEAYALDIQEGYENIKEKDGVKYRMFDPELLSVPKTTGKTLIIAREVFAAIPTSESLVILESIKKLKMDIAIFDIYPNFSISESIVRAGSNGKFVYFHDYVGLLSSIGFKNEFDGGAVHNWLGHPYHMECHRLVYSKH